MTMPTLPPRLYHLADAANWPRIRREGLLTTATLLRTAGLPDGHPWTTEGRATAQVLGDGTYIRDQRPIPPQALERCLDPGIRPADWYGLLAGCVFFWLDAGRMRRHLAAQGGRRTLVLTFDAQALAERYRPVAAVTPFNIGSARRKPAGRGWRTLVPLSRWEDAGWSSEAPPGRPPRPSRVPPAEFLVRGDMADALSFLADPVADPMDVLGAPAARALR